MSKIREIVNSQGVQWWFYCPGCNDAHAIDSSWEFDGNLEEPTINPSILVHPSDNGYIKRCHSFVRNGKIEFLGDCEHTLAGQTVELPQVSEGEGRDK